MSRTTKLLIGLTLISMTTIEYGGTFLLSLLANQHPELALTDFQRSMFRAGHAHAGVLVLLSLICQLCADHARLPPRMMLLLRAALIAAPLLVSGGFFAAAIGSGRTEPSGLIALLWAGVMLLGLSLLTLGAGLIRARDGDPRASALLG